MTNKVFLALPFYGGGTPEALPGLIAPAITGKNEVMLDGKSTSILPHTFNMLLCEAINKKEELGITHFAMIHADIAADMGWVDTLIAEMDRVNADVVSTVIPIKDEKGLTSTGVWDAGVGNVRRFTMREVAKFPKTFDAKDAGYPEWPLCVNTGLWVGRLSGWEQKFPGFEFKSRIVTLANGKKAARNHPEDWLFSRWAHYEGLKVYATTAVNADHHGLKAYSNQGTWGTWWTDNTYHDIVAEMTSLSEVAK